MSFSSSQDRDPVVVHDPPSLPHALARVHSAPSLKHAASMIAAAGFPVFHLIPRGKIPHRWKSRPPRRERGPEPAGLAAA